MCAGPAAPSTRKGEATKQNRNWKQTRMIGGDFCRQSPHSVSPGPWCPDPCRDCPTVRAYPPASVWRMGSAETQTVGASALHGGALHTAGSGPQRSGLSKRSFSSHQLKKSPSLGKSLHEEEVIENNSNAQLCMFTTSVSRICGRVSGECKALAGIYQTERGQTGSFCKHATRFKAPPM